MNNQSDHGYSSDACSMRCIACGSYELKCCDGNGGPFVENPLQDLKDALVEMYDLTPDNFNNNPHVAGSGWCMGWGQGCNAGWDAAIRHVLGLIEQQKAQ